jgi:2C-methyl-D-erythritol 2,4-cyclodiphosphate synthase
MRDAIARLLGLAVGEVSVKAATGNLSGDAGAGRSIEAEAIATIERAAAPSGVVTAAASDDR